jgi:HEAT repeat protein
MGLREFIADRTIPERRIARLRNRGDVIRIARILIRGDSRVRHLAAVALGDLGDPKAVPALLSVMEGPDEDGLRWRAAESLAQIGSGAVDGLADLTRSDDPDVRWKAILALGEIGDRRIVPVLLERLADPDRFVRSRAVSAIVRIGLPGIPLLIEALDDHDPHVRQGAADALGQIGDPVAIEGLLRTLTDPIESVRRAAAVALLRLNPSS